MKFLPKSPGEWWQLARRMGRFYSSARVPRGLKIAVVALCALYFLLPTDLLLDRFPLLGRLDDLTAIALIHLGAVVWAQHQYRLDEPERSPASLQADPAVTTTVDVPGRST
ncbi:DUF1232 domain-containing protein [Gloeobacter violaceus]|uniref:DUF1232 domain-containing protein n=1 Tax=Gloeobacter violaceus TaxID=33072 RepID=UPI0002F97339|nr:YkvA family protein [Gloeobacter violaceus]